MSHQNTWLPVNQNLDQLARFLSGAISCLIPMLEQSFVLLMALPALASALFLRRIPRRQSEYQLPQALALAFLLMASAQGQGWVDVSSPTNNPGGRSHAGMCYDEAHGYCLLSSGDTWTYDGSSWSHLSPLHTPTIPSQSNGARVIDYQLVYDSARARCLLGISLIYVPQGTSAYRHGAMFWEWDGSDWNQAPSLTFPSQNYPWNSITTSQPVLQICDMAYDRIRQETVLFMFREAGGSTFVYDGASWTQKSPLMSPPISCHPSGTFSIFYDEARNRVAMVASNPPSYWEWNGASGNWSQCFPGYLGAPITNGSFGPIAYSPTQAVGVGLGVTLPYTTVTLGYGNSDITIKSLPSMPAVRYDYSIAFDRQRSRFVLVGGSGFADTWELDLGPLASFTATGTGCPGSHGTPTLASNGGVPRAGQLFTVQVSGMAWNQPSFMFLGFSDISYAGLPLPLDLGFLGAPGCLLRASGDYLYGFANVLGVGIWQFGTPNAPGLSLYNQAILFDPTANALGLTVSNSGHMVIGN